MANAMLMDLVKLLLALASTALAVWTMLEWTPWFTVWITLAIGFTVWLFLGSTHRAARKE